MVRRLWSALLLACLFSNTASAQILARPDLDNQDPVRCFDHVSRDARNAVQAYQIVYAPGWKEEVGCHDKVPAPDLEPCWPPVLQARPLIEQAAMLFERARRTYAPEQGQLVAQANALIRQAAGLLNQAGKCFQPILARWTQNGGHYVASRDTGSDNTNSEGGGDTFNVNSGAGQGPPGEPRIDQYGRDTECGGTDRRYYDEMYGTKAVVMSVQQMNGLYSQGRIIRCGACRQNVICWLKPAPTAGSPPPPQHDGAGQGTAPPPPPRFPGRQPPVCDLERLAAIVFQQYGPDKPPIAIYTVRNRPQGTYLVALQGLESGVVGGYDVSQAWLSGARAPELALAYDVRNLAHGDDQYRAAILDAVQRLPRGKTPTNLILTGHSAGGIEAQNLVAELTKRDFRVERVITFGAPITADKVPSTRYTYVKSQGDPVAWLDQRTDVMDTVVIPPGSNANPFADGGSHSIYPKSRELALKSPDFFDTCLDLVFFAAYGLAQGHQATDERIQPKGTNRWLPCAAADFAGTPPLNSFDPWSANPSWKQAWASEWQNAKTQAEQMKVSERIGEAGMTAAARTLGYTTVLSPGQASQRPQGFDAVYRDRDGTLVIAEAKGSAPSTVNNVLKFGYNCRQGTMGWAWRAAEATLTSTTSNSAEQRVAQTIMNSIRSGNRVRVEVFVTEHLNGVPQPSKHYVTASYP